MSRFRNWSVVHLADVPALVPVLANWFRQAWRPYYGVGGTGDAEADLACCLNRGRLPAAYVALDPSGNPVGTASLRRTSVGSGQFPGPWLSALLVAEQHRGRGIGTGLVLAVEEEAGRAGFPALYASMHPASTLLRRCGWHALGSAASLRGSMTVFGKYLI